MPTIYIDAAGGYEMELSRRRFAKLDHSPCKSAIANLETRLRRYLADFRDDAPEGWPLTPYQQWAICSVYVQFKDAHPRTRLQQIEQFIIHNRDQLRRDRYERRKIHPNPSVHGAA